MRKPALSHMWTIKAQISLHILISAFVIRYLENTRSVPKVCGLPAKLSFLLSDFPEIPQNVTLMSHEFFGIFYKAE